MKVYVLIFFSFLSFVGINACKIADQPALSAKEFKTLIDSQEVTLIDVRTPQEFALGNLVGSENIDIYDNDFYTNISKLDKEKPIALYCKSGGRSDEALKILKKNGFKTVYSLKGGLLAWEKEGYKLNTVAVSDNISSEEFTKLIHSAKVVVVDFSAVWCGPCKQLKPILDKLSETYKSKDVKIITIDVDDSKALSNQLQVSEIPLVLFYQNGKLKEQMIGFNPENIITSVIEKYLN